MLIFEFPAKLQRHHLWLRGRRPAMKKHEILSPQSRAELFDPPTDPAAIVRQYTFSLDDLTLIRQRRRDANRLGFAVHLAYLKFPGRVLGSEEAPASDMVAFLAQQLGVGSDVYSEYAHRDETRREHLGDIQSYLCVRPFSRGDYRYVAKIATTEAIGTDRGHAIVAAIVDRQFNPGLGTNGSNCGISCETIFD
jgi:TnpA family transposase